MQPYEIVAIVLAVIVCLILIVHTSRRRPSEQVGLDAARHRAAMAGRRLGVSNDKRHEGAALYARRDGGAPYPPRPVSAFDNRHDDGLANGGLSGSLLSSHSPSPATSHDHGSSYDSSSSSSDSGGSSDGGGCGGGD